MVSALKSTVGWTSARNNKRTNERTNTSAGQHALSYQFFCRSVKALRRYGRFSIFQDGGRPPAWICYTPVWTIYEVYSGGLCHCAKFGLNRFSSFDNMQVLILILSVKLENAYSRPFLGRFGGKIGKSEIFL